MATSLSNPIAREPVTHQGITSLQVRVPHKRSADGTQAVINRDRVSVTYVVTTWDGEGNEISQAARTVNLADWPAAFTTDVRSVYTKLETDAKNAGLIGAGTDEPI